MNTFYEHHQDSIRFAYRCFDRMLLNGLIQPFQQPERVVGFFGTYRNQYPVSRDLLRDIADQFHHWVTNRSGRWGVPILDGPPKDRDKFVEPYFRQATPDRVVAILKAREPARILIAIGKKAENQWHLQFAQRWVMHYNFYVNDREWGRLFVRMCPYFPFSARVCLNQHHWIANKLRAEGITFRQCTNAFLSCGDPTRLQEVADSLTARDLGQMYATGGRPRNPRDRMTPCHVAIRAWADERTDRRIPKASAPPGVGSTLLIGSAISQSPYAMVPAGPSFFTALDGRLTVKLERNNGSRQRERPRARSRSELSCSRAFASSGRSSTTRRK